MKPKKGKARWPKGISHGKRRRRNRPHPIESPPCYHFKWARSLDCVKCPKIGDCYRIWFRGLRKKTG